MEQPLSIEIEHDDDICIVNMIGSAYSDDSEYIQQEFEKVEREKKVIINMEKLDFISSTTLGIILKLAKTIRANKGDLRIASPKQFVHKTLKVTRISDIIQTFPTLSGALTSFI